MSGIAQLVSRDRYSSNLRPGSVSFRKFRWPRGFSVLLGLRGSSAWSCRCSCPGNNGFLNFRDVARLEFRARIDRKYQSIHPGTRHVMIKRFLNRRDQPCKVHAGVNLPLECLNDRVFKGVRHAREIENIVHGRPSAILFRTARIAANSARTLLQHARDRVACFAFIVDRPCGRVRHSLNPCLGEISHPRPEV
jgi:hypothetical protein